MNLWSSEVKNQLAGGRVVEGRGDSSQFLKEADGRVRANLWMCSTGWMILSNVGQTCRLLVQNRKLNRP